MSHHHQDDELHDHDKGLSHDLPRLLSRRRALAMLGGAGLFAVAGCADDEPVAGTAASPSASASSGAATATSSASSGEEIPEETGGPFPADGSNGVNVLTESGIVRSDITKSFGSGSGVATGVPLTVRLTVLDVSSGAGPLAGAAIYLWHCDSAGNYSLYSQGVEDENYLRGVQETAADGSVTFTSIFPAAYSGRWPHIHFEVYPSLAAATSASDRMRTSQLALPEAESKLVYATAGYEQSVPNLAETSLDTDMVFSDGYSLQLARMSGNVTDGLVATLNVPV
jgi:protocatechuate 3,4-dioxygenase beta subunit